MLVLGRKVGETVVIDGGRIVVQVVEIKSNAIRLGFITSKDVEVNRGEVQARIDLEKIHGKATGDVRGDSGYKGKPS